jgi:hypothetical protein
MKDTVMVLTDAHKCIEIRWFVFLLKLTDFTFRAFVSCKISDLYIIRVAEVMVLIFTDICTQVNWNYNIYIYVYIYIWKKKGYQITVQTQLCLCVNRLHVSAIYSYHQAEHKTANTSKTVTQCKNCMDEILSFIMVLCFAWWWLCLAETCNWFRHR